MTRTIKTVTCNLGMYTEVDVYHGVLTVKNCSCIVTHCSSVVNLLFEQASSLCWASLEEGSVEKKNFCAKKFYQVLRVSVKKLFVQMGSRV